MLAWDELVATLDAGPPPAPDAAALASSRGWALAEGMEDVEQSFLQSDEPLEFSDWVGLRSQAVGQLSLALSSQEGSYVGFAALSGLTEKGRLSRLARRWAADLALPSPMFAEIFGRA